MSRNDIPGGLEPYFQEYDVHTLDLDRDADLIIQRTLEHGTWDIEQTFSLLQLSLLHFLPR